MNETEKHGEQDLVDRALREQMTRSEEYFFVKDQNLVYHVGSETFARMAGLPCAAALEGKTDLDLFPPDIAQKYRGDDEKVVADDVPIMGIAERLPDADGRERWVRTWKYPVHDERGRVIGLYGIGRDVSGEVALQEQARTTENYIDLINHIPGGVAVFHIRGGHAYLDYANDGCLDVHHMTRENIDALIGSQVISAVYEADRPALAAELARLQKEPGAVGGVNYRVVGDDGKLHWVGLRFRAAYEKDGMPYYYAAYSGMDTQKAMEESLAESRNALKEALLNTDLQFFTYYPGQGRCENLMLNSRFSRLPTVWKHYPEDFLEYTKASPADAENYRAMIRAIDRGENHAECVMRFAYNGGFLWEKINVTAIRDSEGKTVRAQGYSVDITERVNAEERIRKERMRLKSMENGVFESFSFNLTKVTDPEIQTSDSELMKGSVSGEILREALALCPPLAEGNPATREILLRAAARIPDASDRALFISTCSGEAVRTAVREGRFFKSIRYRRWVENEIRWVSTSAEVLPDPENGDLIAFYYTADINRQVIWEKLSSDIVHRNYASVSVLTLASGIYSVVSGTDENLRELSGMRYTDVLEKAQKEFVAACDTEQYLRELSLDAVVAALEQSPLYTVYNRRNQTVEHLPGKPLRRMKNDIFYLDEHRDVLVFLLTDVTEIYEQERETREKLETALIAAKQASSAKSNFLSRMSHEIRTPLNGIIGMDTIAAQSINNPEKVADCVAKIGLSARYLLSLINDILDMSRIESGKMLLKNEKFLFSDLIAGINTMIYNQTKSKGLDYECTVASEIAPAYIGDAMKLQQVLLNILGNAVKFTKTGKVTLDVRLVSDREDQAVVRFTVNDTGIGIQEDHLEKIFSPFEQEDTTTTTVFGGTGLGLAITKNLVNLMGGSIRVRSIVGIGSEFTVDVPLTIDASAIVRPKLNLHLEKMSALIVDDDLIVCEQAQKTLQDIGMIGEWVTSGLEAISRVRANHAKSAHYDFILIDWKMPDMDGMETTRQIRRIVGPDVTIIIITAYDWESIELEAKAAGANLLISKPLLKSSLISAFQRARGQETPREQKPRSFDFTGRRVLVAEDNQINSEIARTLLEEKHLAVETVTNGLRAMELFLKNPAGYYDAILMDIRMPLMDGLQATVNIRHCNKTDARTVPIIAMTANAFDEDVEKSRAAGMNAHLSKPIDPDYMYAVLDHLFDQR